MGRRLQTTLLGSSSGIALSFEPPKHNAREYIVSGVTVDGRRVSERIVFGGLGAIQFKHVAHARFV